MRSRSGHVLLAVVAAALLSACGGKLSARGTANRLLRDTSATEAHCVPVNDYWDYECKLRARSGDISVLVRVNGSAIVEQSAP